MSLQAPWHARIMGPNGPVGAGVLVDARRIVTCAHVIEQALDLGDLRPTPSGPVTVHFPQSAGEEILSARVMTNGWFPGRPGSRAGDLAMLEVLGDDVRTIVAAPLRYAGDDSERVYGVFGHPAGHGDGTWARARLTGIGGPGRQWVQLDAVAAIGRRIEPGFSGAGLLDEQDGTVVGIVVVADRAAHDRVAWMIPVEVICKYWPELRTRLRSGPLARKAFGPEAPPPGADVTQLARKLLELRGINDRLSRGLFISAVENQFPGRLVVQRSDDDFEDTIAFIKACLGHPGALHELIERLRMYHAGDADEERRVEEIAAIAEGIDPAPLLDAVSRNRLYRMLTEMTDRISPDMVRDAYREATGPVNPEPIDPRDLPSVIRILESATMDPNGLPPLLRFLEALARRLSRADADGLRAWVDDFARRDGTPRHLISGLRLSIERPDPDDSSWYLRAQLLDFGADEDRYLSHVTLMQGNRRDLPRDARVLYAGNVPLTVTEIPPLFDSVLESMWALPDVTIGKMVVEFVMPLELLGAAVDQWQVQTSVQLGHPLCVEHHVIVRYRDRADVKRGYRQWQEKTRRLRAGDTRIRWADPTDTATLRSLYSQLFNGGPPCLALEQPPVMLGRKLGGDAVSAAIWAGVPVIVWCRDRASANPFAAWLRQHLGNQGALDMPTLVQQMRDDFINLSYPPGEHITLVWDLEDEPTSLVTRYQAPG